MELLPRGWERDAGPASGTVLASGWGWGQFRVERGMQGRGRNPRAARTVGRWSLGWLPDCPHYVFGIARIVRESLCETRMGPPHDILTESASVLE